MVSMMAPVLVQGLAVTEYSCTERNELLGTHFTNERYGLLEGHCPDTASSERDVSTKALSLGTTANERIVLNGGAVICTTVCELDE